MKYGIYRINPGYLKVLKDIDPNIPSSEANLYVGPVVTITTDKGSLPGYVLLDETHPFADIPNGIRFARGLVGDIDLNIMIPCPDKYILSEETQSPALQFVIENESVIKRYAEKIKTQLMNQK